MSLASEPELHDVPNIAKQETRRDTGPKCPPHEIVLAVVGCASNRLNFRLHGTLARRGRLIDGSNVS